MQRIYICLSLVLLIALLSYKAIEVFDKTKVDNTKNVQEIVHKKNIWVFLMAGQSNMAGRGIIERQDTAQNSRIITINNQDDWIIAKEPLHFYEKGGLDCGLSFAQEMLKQVPDSITIAMVPCAVGGSSVFKWLSDKEHRSVKLLSNFNEKVQLSKKKGVIKGILWHQGESNANREDLPVYADSLLKLFEKFRSVVQNDKLPIVMGELGRFAQPQEMAGHFKSINQIIAVLAKKNNNLYSISSEGLDHKGDHLHFNSDAQRQLGKRYAHMFGTIYKAKDW